MKYILPLLLIWAFPSQIYARWLSLKEAGSVVERYYVDYEVFKDGSWTQTEEFVARVQSEDAKSQLGTFSVDYNSLTDQVELLEAFTLNGREKTPVDRSAIEDRDKGEARDYDVLKSRIVVFPQVRVGSRVHIKYRVKTTKPLIQGRWSSVEGHVPFHHFEKIRVRVKSQLPLFDHVHDPRGWFSVRRKDKFNIEITNKKVLPGGVHAEKDSYFHEGFLPEIWMSTHKDWAQFFEGFGADYERIISQPLPAALKSWIKLAQAKRTAEEQVLYLMQQMSHDFRYFGDWRRHDGGLIPRSLEAIEKSRSGDCKDLASLLAAMLRALKMEAHVALVRRGDNPWGREPDYVLPATRRFNHAIVRLKLPSGKTLWLDPTNPVSSLEPFSDIRGRPAFVLNSSGGVFDRLPEAKAEHFESTYDYDYDFKQNDSVKVHLRTQWRRLAPQMIANELLLSPRSTVLSSILAFLTNGDDLKSYKFIKEPSSSRILKDLDIVLEYVVGGVTYRAGKASFFVISDGLLSAAFYETENRESDLRLSDDPFSTKSVHRLKNTRLVQDPPAPCIVESEWMRLERQIVVEGSDVAIYQIADLRRSVISREEFRSSAFKKLQAETRRCFYRSGVLVEPVKGTLSSRAQ